MDVTFPGLRLVEEITTRVGGALARFHRGADGIRVGRRQWWAGRLKDEVVPLRIGELAGVPAVVAVVEIQRGLLLSWLVVTARVSLM